jgi:hypothetical protein
MPEGCELMTLIELPEGHELPTQLGGGTCLLPIDGYPGCYEGLYGWAEFQWRELEFDDSFASREHSKWWRDHFLAVERGDIEPPIDWEAAPPIGYGIGDSPEQILAHPDVSWVYTDLREMIVVFTEVRREDQPPRDGWRFHKNGTYIGEHNVEWEYLADQDGVRGERIDSVYMYHVIQVTKRETPLEIPED